MAKASDSYIGLARKWRPKTFDEVVGQPQAVDTLRLDVVGNRVKHAYLFSGPRGVGKTSMARILAKAMNCDRGPTPQPCGVCDRCRAIPEGFDVDTIEIDAATYTKVENIRELQEGFNRAPLGGRWKVYIIDEVHMLSDSSFNALLKSLEEPPSRVIFVLATTNPEKIPETVQSRCTRVEFRRITPEDIVKQLSVILDSEKSVKVKEGEREAILESIALASEGGLRDAEVALDQLISLGEEVITLERVQQLLGLVDSALLHDSVVAMAERDTRKLLAIVQSLVDRGRDIQRFVKALLHYLRDLLVLRVSGSGEEDVAALGVVTTQAGFGDMRDLTRRLDTPFLLNATSQFLVLDERLRGLAPARFLLEFTFLKMAEVDRSIDIGAALNALSGGRGPSSEAGPGRSGAAHQAKGPSRSAADPDSGGLSNRVAETGPSTPYPGASPGRDRRPAPSELRKPSTPPAALIPTATAPLVSGSRGPSAPSDAQERPIHAQLNITPVGTADAGLFWRTLVGELNQRFVMLATNLNRASLLEIKPSAIRIGVPAGPESEMALRLLNRPDKRRDLEALASAVAGRPFKIQVETIGPGLAPPPVPAPTDSTMAPSPLGMPESEGVPPGLDPTAPPQPVSALPGDFPSLPDTPAYEYEYEDIGLADPGRAPGPGTDPSGAQASPPQGLPMITYQEALRRYPELRDAVDLVRKAFKANPQDLNGRPIP